MQPREIEVRVIDHETYPGNKTSKNIKKKEYARLYPGVNPIQLNFIFEHKRQKVMPEKQAKFLARKYGKVIEIVGREEIKLRSDEKAMYDVDNMKRPALVNLAYRLSIEGAMKLKNDPLRETIKAKLIEGVSPMSQSEWEEKKKTK